MNEGYNIIQYAIPENSEMAFSILSHVRDVLLVLVNGVANFCVKDREVNIPPRQEFPIPIWECLWPRLKAKTACNLIVQGSHYIYFPTQDENVKFSVLTSGNSFSFVLGKDIQIQILPVQYTEEDVCITIRKTRGAPEIYGYKLSSNATYYLTPYSPVLIKSSNDEPYSIHVEGLDRKVRLSVLDENHQMRVKAARDYIFSRCLFAKKFKHINPKILVLGPKSVGKSSFCRLLVNNALEEGISPLYVDLNIQRNFTLPGSLSISEIESRIDSTLEYEYRILQLLHFGAVIFHPINMRLYYFLIRKLSGLLSFHQKNINKDSLTVIDTAGSQGDNIIAVERIVKSFNADLVVVIGDQHYYEKLKHSVLKTVPSEFIPEPDNIPPQNDYYDSKYYQYSIKEYFYGSIVKPSVPSIRTVRLNCFAIYKISVSGSSRNADDERFSDCNIERIICNPGMVDRLLAVSAAKSVEFLTISEVKYYICITEIHAAAKMATVMAPASENFNGGILLMGHVLRFKK